MLRTAVSLILFLFGTAAGAAEQKLNAVDRLFMNIHTAKQLEIVSKILMVNKDDVNYLHEVLAQEDPNTTFNFARSGDTAVFSVGADKVTVDVKRSSEGIFLINGH